MRKIMMDGTSYEALMQQIKEANAAADVLRKTNAHLASTIQLQEKMVADEQKRRMDIQKKSQLKDMEIEELRAQVAKVKNLAEDYQELSNTSDHMKNSISALNGRLAEVGEELAEEKSFNGKARSKIVELVNQVKDLEDQNRELVGENSRLADHLRSEDNAVLGYTVDRLRNAVDQKDEVIATLRRKVAGQASDINQLIAKLSMAKKNGDVAILEKRLEAAYTACRDRDSVISDLTDQLKEAQKKIEAMDTKGTPSSWDALVKITEVCRGKDVTIERLHKQIQDLERNKHEAVDTISSYKSELEVASREQKEQEKRFRAAIEEKTKMIEEQHAKINHLVLANRSLAATVDRLDKAKNTFQEAFEQACDAGVAAEEEGGVISNLRERVAYLTKANDSLAKIINKMQANKDCERNQVIVTRHGVMPVNADSMSKLSREIDAYRQTIDSLERKLRETPNAGLKYVETSVGRVPMTEEGIARLVIRIIEEQDRADYLNDTVSDLTKENKILKARIENAIK